MLLLACTPDTPSGIDLPGQAAGPRALHATDMVHRLLRLEAPIHPAQREELGRQGIVLLSRREEGWVLAAGPRAAFDDLAGRLAVHRPAPEEKLGPRLREMMRSARPAGQDLRLWVLLSFASLPQRGEDPGQDGPAAAALLRPVARVVRRVGFVPLFEVSCPASSVMELAALDPVRHVELPPGPAIPLLDGARQAIGVETVQAASTATAPPTYKVSGKGLVAAVWDPHGVDPKTQDLLDNLLRYPDPKVPSSLSHGTAVGGCLAGSGVRSAASPTHPWQPYQLRGIAPEAKLVMYATAKETDASGKETTFFDQYLEARNTYGASVVNFSFSLGYQAVYEHSGANLDQIIAGRGVLLPEPVPFTLSAGNEGAKYGYGSVSGLGSAKNVLTVGASDWADGTLVSFSSFGPTKDGRLKPEVLAPGCSAHGKTTVGLDRVRVLGPSGTIKEWTFDSSTEGWTVVRDLGPLTVTSGVLQAATTGNDPGVYSPDDLGLDPTQATKVEITLSATRHHRAELFWKTDKGSFHSSRRKDFFISADGKLHSYTLDLSGHSGWKDVIERLRIDPLVTGIAMPTTGNTYTVSCGTSMSSPIAAGAILLLLQTCYETLIGAVRPSPALLKALLVATARDMEGQGPGKNPDLNNALTPYTKGPDFATGYGEIDLVRATSLVRSAASGPQPFLESTLARTGRRVNVRLRLAGTLPGALAVTLAWDDPPGEPGSGRVLQNDLDLEVRTPDGAVHLPWVLDPGKPEQAAKTGADHTNNLEQVALSKPQTGDTIITVTGYEMMKGPQPFALVLSDATALSSLTLDADGDGSYETDCDDADPAVHPGATEVVGNGKDDDCDPSTADSPGAADGGDSALSGADAGGASSEKGAGPAAQAGQTGCSCITAGAALPAPGAWVLLFVLVVAWGLRSEQP